MIPIGAKDIGGMDTLIIFHRLAPCRAKESATFECNRRRRTVRGCTTETRSGEPFGSRAPPAIAGRHAHTTQAVSADV